MKNREVVHYDILIRISDKKLQSDVIKEVGQNYSWDYIRTQINDLVEVGLIEKTKYNNRSYYLKITEKGEKFKKALYTKLSLLYENV